MSGELAGILLLTLRVAAVATLFVVPPALVVAYALARLDFRGKRLVSAVTGLPLVLPPTAVGFLLLAALLMWFGFRRLDRGQGVGKSTAGVN